MDAGPCEINTIAGLSEFTGSMDPLLAAAARNKEFSPLLKLPDEILLPILQFLQPDARDIYYIRRVCRRLRCLADDHTLEPRLFSTNTTSKGSHMLYRDRFLGRENNRMPFGILPWSGKKGSENDFVSAGKEGYGYVSTYPDPTLHHNRGGRYLSLVLCWKPYSGSKILTAPENGQLEATRLRELYDEFGKNAARFIVPGPSQNTTPEMLCFNPDKCGHILYRNGERPQATTSERLCTPHLSRMNRNSPVTTTEIPLDEDHQDPSRFMGLGWTDHYVEFNEARGQSGIYVYECDGKHNSQDSTRCLMTSYRRTIMLGHIDHRRPGALNPSHQWFHAVDQDSYPSIQAEGRIWAKLMTYFDTTMSRPRFSGGAFTR
ncbi:hypothetical protein LA080_004376 [Diaporthe eres]|nr:hypothetical protein LA080_004376 [Diaporthe eres]